MKRINYEDAIDTLAMIVLVAVIAAVVIISYSI